MRERVGERERVQWSCAALCSGRASSRADINKNSPQALLLRQRVRAQKPHEFDRGVSHYR